MASHALPFTPQPTLPNPARAPEVLNLLLRIVNLSLSLGLNETALFISERYSCLCPQSEEAAFLHALSLLRCSEHRQALELLKSTIVEPPPVSHSIHTTGFHTHASSLRTRRPACEASVRCAWVYAEACIALDRPNEGGECLKRAFMIFGNDKLSLPDYTTFAKPQAALSSESSVCVNLSLAKLAARAHKHDIAAQRYNDALRAAWWCWEAYEGLCSLGKAPDADQTFAPIPVPEVQDPIDRQQDPPAASFLAAPPMDTHNNFSRRSTSSQGGGRATAASSSLHSTSHPIPEQRSTSVTSQSSFFRTSTPNFQFDGGQPFFGAARGGKGNAAVTSTPVESQGAAFRFSEADAIEEEIQGGSRVRGSSMEPTAGPRLSTSIDDVQHGADESSFWNPAAAAKKASKTQSNGVAGNGGLFGVGGPKSAPLFGQGLLFGQNGASKSETSRSTNGNASTSTGGFFTPVNMMQNGSSQTYANGADGNAVEAPHASTSRPANGRPLPANKRAIHQIDETAPDDSFQFQFGAAQQRRGQGSIHPNGLVGSRGSVEAEEILVDDVANNGGVNGGNTGNGASRPGYTTRQGSQLTDKTGHRLNGNGLPLDTAAPGMTFAAKANRIVSNPRDRKRTKAGPSSYDDASTATTTSSSHSVDTNSALYARSSSSPPPGGVGGGQSENEPHEYEVPASLHNHGSSANGPARTPSAAATAIGSAGLGKAHSQQTAPLQHPSIHNLASQPLTHAPSAERQLSYRKQLEAAQNALAENWLRSIYRQFAKAYAHMSRYECPGATKAILSLPKEQRESSRAILLLGEAYFESLDYNKAEQAFSAVRALSPYVTRGMEIYSTLLWHLHRPTHLSYLSQELLEISPTLPQAWIATGNVFSHLEDHPNSLKCFKRAIQCNSNFTYAYTLAGHESVTMEEWDVAVGFFREAIRVDPRHYNAWFGLGNVYMKTGKYRMAEYHFRKAVEINSTNAMLVCCVGTVLEKLDRKKEALELYEQACLLAPTSPAVRFKRVRMLMDLKNYDSALRDLMLVRDMAPDEFNVHYLLGKLYGAMGDRVNMTRNLTIAQDLEPRAAGRIREIIEAAAEEGMDADEENEEDEDDDDDVEISVTRGRRNVDGQAGEGEGDSTREEIQGDEGTETEASEDESMS